jgi:hypothetical protein
MAREFQNSAGDAEVQGFPVTHQEESEPLSQDCGTFARENQN